MTLRAYDADRLDVLALKLIDLAAISRRMAAVCRQEGVKELSLNDKKALDWMARIEGWLGEAEARLQARLIKRRAAQHASLMEQPAARRRR
jgi:hypothetical protein